MCKYCDETLYRFEHKRFVTKEEMYEPIDKNFCVHCGTPLGEVKPLTVEQLRQMDGKPVFVVETETEVRRWCVVSSCDGLLEVEIPGCDYFSYKQYNYSKLWLAFDREPKGEAE